MLCRAPILTLLAAAITFAAEGVNVTVNARVDSRINSVTLKAKLSLGESQTLGPVNANGTAKWNKWEVGTAYTAIVTSVSTGYTPRWSVTKSGMSELSGGTNQTITLASTSYSECTLNFYGEPNTYRVDFDRQSGSGGTSSVTATYDAAMPTATMPTRTGYTFGGYFTETNGNGTQYYNADGSSTRPWDIDGARTLYAKWTAGTYTVTLDPQQGSGGMTSVSATYGSALQQTITTPTREGYRFGGYFSETNGGGKKYYDQNGEVVVATSTFTADTSIYAYWIRVWNVTFELNGASFKSGSGWTTATNYAEGVGLTLPAGSDMTYANHTFDGWTEAGSSGYVTAIGSSATGDKTFLARWSGETYNVTFSANDGTGRSGEQEMSMVNTQWLKPISELFDREGYAFAAWNKAADGSGDSYGDHAEISTANLLTNAPGAYVVLYAQWTPNPYEVAFNANGADGGETMANQSFAYDVTQNLNHVEFTYTGHAFERWSGDTNYNYQTKYYADGAEVANLTATSNAVVNLYANWTGIVYTVTFDANGGEGAMEPIVCTYNVPTNLPACTFARDGWGFKGWTTNGADGVLFTDRARVTNLTATAGADVALLACWTGVTYAVTLDARDSRGDGLMTNDVGEAVSVLTNRYTVGDAWTLPTPTNVNEHLRYGRCWKYVNAEGQMCVLPDTVPPPSHGVTNLVATWTWEADALAVAVDAPELEFDTFGTKGPYGNWNETDESYSANWLVQSAEFVQNGMNESAVQSGVLHEDDYNVYASWLTTTVQTNGVLSFWWKCSAAERTLNGYGEECGDALRFGVCAEDGEFNEITNVSGVVDWTQVVYTNDTGNAVRFAWKFQYDYSGDGSRTGGGTGWVDRVTWTPEGAPAEVTTTHGVPYKWLREKLGASAAATAEELESLAEVASPNGKAWPDGTQVKVWEDYWAGTDPNDPNDLFRAFIAVTNDVPTITWQPDMRTGTPERVYHVLCAPTPSTRSEEWVEWPGTEGAATNRFFKVELDLEGSRQK